MSSLSENSKKQTKGMWKSKFKLNKTTFRTASNIFTMQQKYLAINYLFTSLNFYYMYNTSFIAKYLF